MSIGGATPACGTGKTKITTLGAMCRIVSTPDSKIDFAQKKNRCKRKKIKKTYNTRDSLVVPYQSTDRAQPCLTSQFGWDAVLSWWYDRMTISLERHRIKLEKAGPDAKDKNPGREI